MKAIAKAAFLLLAAGVLLTLSAQSQLPNIIGAASRNVKNYGAKGDGITDDTQAFIAALQSNRKPPNGVAEKAPASVYVPPGTYLISSTLIIWRNTQLFGEWTNPPTLVLAPDSTDFQDASRPTPVVVTAGALNVPDDTTEWKTRTSDTNGSTNNTFFCSLEDINIQIGANNPGAWGVFWWCAQQSDVRNVNINAGNALGCIQTNGWGGGSTIANCAFSGGQVGFWSDATAFEYIRDCSFSGQTQHSIYLNGVRVFTFQNIHFNNTASFLINAGCAGADNLLNCSFVNMPGATLEDPYAHDAMHIENMTFDAKSEVPTFLQNAVQNGVVKQWTNRGVVSSGQTVSGFDIALENAMPSRRLRSAIVPRPTSDCVNIQALGGRGDGAIDNTQVIQSALAHHSEIFFPTGTYLVTQPLTISGGQKLYGQAGSVIQLASSASAFQSSANQAFITVNGNGLAPVSFSHLWFYNSAPAGICIQWNADPASVTLDCTFNNSSSSSPTFVVTTGGLFEETLTFGNSSQTIGITVENAQGPTFFDMITDQHFTQYSMMLSGAANVFLANVDFEDAVVPGQPGAILKIIDSTNIFLYGIAAGSFPSPDLIEINGAKNLSLWSMTANNISCFVTDSSSGAPTTYGPSSNNDTTWVDFGGYVLRPDGGKHCQKHRCRD